MVIEGWDVTDGRTDMKTEIVTHVHMAIPTKTILLHRSWCCKVYVPIICALLLLLYACKVIENMVFLGDQMTRKYFIYNLDARYCHKKDNQ